MTANATDFVSNVESHKEKCDRDLTHTQLIPRRSSTGLLPSLNSSFEMPQGDTYQNDMQGIISCSLVPHHYNKSRATSFV